MIALLPSHLRGSRAINILIGATSSVLVIAVTSTTRGDNATPFLGVAAGDVDTSSAVIWTRTSDPTSNGLGNTDTAATGQAATITGTIFSDPGLSSIVTTVHGSTAGTNDYTFKTAVSALNPGTTYYYRFSNDVTNALSNVGTFKTAPAPGAAAPVHFGFSGDVDGLMRPYISLGGVTGGGAPTVRAQKFDFYVNLGDTIYETASTGSAAANVTVAPSTATVDGVITGGATQAQLLADYHRKYKEQFLPVNSGGQKGMFDFYAAQGNYTLLDNHELGNRQYINGGAPAGPAVGGMPSGGGVDARPGAGNDHNSTGAFMNKTVGFQSLQQAYLDYQPIRDRGTQNTPTDPNTDGTKQMYFAQQWGKNALYVNVDDRSYRDIRLKTSAGADDNGSRADNPSRTMLAGTQLSWLKQTLLNAQNVGTPWKFVAISSPIDQIGPIGGSLSGVAVGSDGGKSWMGGYRAERNDLLKFIADHHIENVVFLSTDDHQNRVNELMYSPTGDTGNQASYQVVPHVLEIVDGPMGATGPDAITDHSFANLKSQADDLTSKQTVAGLNPAGLESTYTPFQMLFREGDPTATSNPQPIDFYSPDTFNFSSLDVSADGQTLTVTTYGVNSYASNTFPEASAANPLREILSYSITAVPEPGHAAGVVAAGLLALRSFARWRRTSGPDDRRRTIAETI